MQQAYVLYIFRLQKYGKVKHNYLLSIPSAVFARQVIAINCGIFLQVNSRDCNLKTPLIGAAQHGHEVLRNMEKLAF